MKKESLTYIISISLIVLFIYAAINKLADLQKFEVQISQSPMFHKHSTLVAIMTPLTEIVTSILLSIGATRLLGLYISLALMSAFTSYIVVILNFSTNIPCSCGGVLENLNWNQHLAFNICFLIISLIGALIHPTAQSKETSLNKQLSQIIKTSNTGI